MKKNKNLIILLLIAIIGIVGVTIAYFSSRATFENVFETPEYGTTYIEKFTSPDNWLPGDITEKTLQVTNSGDVDEAVRVKVEESWVSRRGTTLPLTQGNDVAALINFINEDDWTKVTVDEEDYYYYYYNYKLSPEETTSKLLDKVTFNPLINAGTTCSDTVVDGVTTRTCNSNGEGYDGATYTLKLTVETVQYNKYQEAWNTNVVIKEEKPHPGTLTLLEKTNPVSITNYTDGNIHEMYTFEHEETAQTPAQTDYRYIGNDPYNYVYFNCDEPQEGVEYNYSTSCEVWRIIGVFDVEREIDDEENPGQKKTITEARMKLVRGTPLDNKLMWDNRTSEDYQLEWGKNDWNGSLMQLFLIEDFYNRTGNAMSNGLKKSARGIIDEARFYLGASAYSGVSADDLYLSERGRIVCNNTRPLNWQGRIGLMYPSDVYMTYKWVDENCYNNPERCYVGGAPEVVPTQSWIYNTNEQSINNWVLTPQNRGSAYVLLVGGSGGLAGTLGKYEYKIRPVVYLSADVKIIDGDGSSENPYKLK